MTLSLVIVIQTYVLRLIALADAGVDCLHRLSYRQEYLPFCKDGRFEESLEEIKRKNEYIIYTYICIFICKIINNS